MTRDNHDFYCWDEELSDRETFLIGKIIAQWGALEYEVFTQTLMTFDTPDGKEVVLPKTMNNLQFSEVLSLWKERVVDIAKKNHKKLLLIQYEKILKLKDYRDALVHGMWQWSPIELAKISTIRIRKKEVITIHFTADDLESFYRRVASINFKLRFPGGINELSQQVATKGFHISRRGLSLFAGDELANDWLTPFPIKKILSKNNG